MSRLVPLVVYKNGVREILGTAEVLDDGQGLVVHATFNSNEEAKKFLPELSEFSISLNTSKFCFACQTNQCGKGKDEKNCICCQTGHI